MIDEPFDMYEPEDEPHTEEEQEAIDQFSIDKYEAQDEDLSLRD